MNEDKFMIDFGKTSEELDQIREKTVRLGKEMEDMASKEARLFEELAGRANKVLDAQISAIEDAFGEVRTGFDILADASRSMADTAGDAIADSLVDGMWNAQKAVRSLAKTILSELVSSLAMAVARAVALKLALSSITGGAGFIFHEGGEVYHQGGIVPKRFHSGEFLDYDERPAILQAGEFVMRKEAVKSIGPENLARMNVTGKTDSAPQPVNVNFHISSIDPEGVESVVIRRIIPILDKEIGRGAWLPYKS